MATKKKSYVNGEANDRCTELASKLGRGHDNVSFTEQLRPTAHPLTDRRIPGAMQSSTYLHGLHHHSSTHTQVRTPPALKAGTPETRDFLTKTQFRDRQVSPQTRPTVPHSVEATNGVMEFCFNVNLICETPHNSGERVSTHRKSRRHFAEFCSLFNDDNF